MTAARERAVGIALIAVSAASFGALGIFGKVAYDAGGEPVGVLSIRFGIAAAVLTVVMVLRREQWPRGRLLAGLLALGGLCYVGQSLAFFTALTYASASLVAVLLYLYPGLVVLLSRVVLGERLTRAKIAALLLASVGTVLTVGPLGGGQVLGIVLGATSALVYSVYIISSARITPRAGALPSATVVICAAAAVYGVLALLTRPDYPSGLAGALSGVGIALLSTVVAIGTFFAGLRRVGPTDAATVSSLEPAVTVLLAVTLLGESVTPLQLVGGSLVLTGVLVLARAGSAVPSADGPPADGPPADGPPADGPPGDGPPVDGSARARYAFPSPVDGRPH